MTIREALKLIHPDLQAIRKADTLIDFSKQSKHWDIILKSVDDETKRNMLNEYIDKTLLHTLKRFMDSTEYELYKSSYPILEMRRMGVNDRYLLFILFDIAYAINEDIANNYINDEYDDFYYDRIDEKLFTSMNYVYKRLRGYFE